MKIRSGGMWGLSQVGMELGWGWDVQMGVGGGGWGRIHHKTVHKPQLLKEEKGSKNGAEEDSNLVPPSCQTFYT